MLCVPDRNTDESATIARLLGENKALAAENALCAGNGRLEVTEHRAYDYRVSAANQLSSLVERGLSGFHGGKEVTMVVGLKADCPRKRLTGCPFQWVHPARFWA